MHIVLNCLQFIIYIFSNYLQNNTNNFNPFEMDTHTPIQHITYPSSHNEDAVDAGGRNGYPSDSQAALNKNYVDLSDESDQADEELALVTSGNSECTYPVEVYWS